MALPVWAAPPPVEVDPGGDDAGQDGLPGLDEGLDTDGLDPEQLEAQRQEEFRDHVARADRASRDERWSDAVREYTAALKIYDNESTALRGRGHAYAARAGEGRCSRPAIEDLSLLRVFDPRGAWLDERGEVLLMMANCTQAYRQERLELAEELAVLPTDAPGRPNEVLALAGRFTYEASRRTKKAKLARQQRTRALTYFEDYAKECAAAEREQAAYAMRLRADIYRADGRADDALEVYRALNQTHPGHEDEKAVESIINELVIQQRVGELAASQGSKPSPEAEAAYERGVSLVRAGDLRGAMRELEAAVNAHPWYPRAHHMLGQVYARVDRLPQAVESFQKAIAMAPSDYETRMSLGLLYMNYFAGAQDAAARSQLETALKLRPDHYVLHFYLGKLWARADKKQAREHFEAYLRVSKDDDDMAERARQALRELDREVREAEPIVPPPPTQSEFSDVDPELFRLITEAYVLGTENGEWDRAERSLLRAMERFPNEPALYNELAKIVSAQSREGKAREYWEKSLELREDQLEVHERLGILLGDGELGFKHLRRATELGSLSARYVLAEAHWDRFEWLEASRQLERYEREAGPLDIDWERAKLLRERMDYVFLRLYLSLGLLAAFAVALPMWWFYRRIRGSSLRQLMTSAPKSFPEVARILSLIRHEILKHNTAFLSEVGRALAHDEPDAEERSTLLARRLFGDLAHDHPDGRRGRGSHGIHGRFLGYVQELQKVGRAHGVTLNLHRKDPTFSAMLRAFDDLASQAKSMRHPGGLSRSRKLTLAQILSDAGEVLGRSAFERLSALIEELCIAEIDENLLQEAFEQVRTEAQFTGAQIEKLQVHGEPARVRIFRTDLEDVLVNVFRNSLSSSVRYAAPPFALGVDLVLEIDEITGLESLAIRIKDRSPEKLTSEMLRGRYVERGMGITADLLSRYDGAIAVEDEPGWEKAVVLRFFSLDGGAA